MEFFPSMFKYFQKQVPSVCSIVLHVIIAPTILFALTRTPICRSFTGLWKKVCRRGNYTISAKLNRSDQGGLNILAALIYGWNNHMLASRDTSQCWSVEKGFSGTHRKDFSGWCACWPNWVVESHAFQVQVCLKRPVQKQPSTSAFYSFFWHHRQLGELRIVGRRCPEKDKNSTILFPCL